LDIGVFVPILCDLLSSADPHRETLLELIFQYAKHLEAGSTVPYFHCAVDAIREADLAAMAEHGSSTASSILAWLNERGNDKDTIV
jgi:hypothetical protein